MALSMAGGQQSDHLWQPNNMLPALPSLQQELLVSFKPKGILKAIRKWDGLNAGTVIPILPPLRTSRLKFDEVKNKLQILEAQCARR